MDTFFRTYTHEIARMGGTRPTERDLSARAAGAHERGLIAREMARAARARRAARRVERRRALVTAVLPLRSQRTGG